MTWDDSGLLHAVLAGNARAIAKLDALVKRAARGVSARLNLRRARPPFDADDLAQTVHQQLFQHDARTLRTFSGSAKLSSWLYTIAYRHALRALRTTPEPLQELGIEQPTPHHQAARKQTIKQVQAVIGDLPKNDQLLLQMLFEGELSAPAAGRLLGITADGARMRKMRLLRRLAEKLKGLWP